MASTATASGPPPSYWEFEIPRYRATRDLRPAAAVRVRYETPFSTMGDDEVWQYASKPVERGQVILSREWPHPSMRPLTYSAARVMDFFMKAEKSRLPVCPWRIDRVVLDDGLIGSMGPRFRINSGDGDAA